MATPNLRGGIDLGGTKIEAIIVNDVNDVLGSARQPTPTQGGPADVAKEMAATLNRAALAAKTNARSLVGVGVGSPGTIDADNGVVSSARNLPGWDGSFELGPELERVLETKVKVGNDVQVAIEAEYKLGAGRKYKSLVGAFWGTGVGGGIVLNGELWHGRGGAGEIGHMVVKVDGRLCPCGNKGCLEAYAGRAAMEAHARKLHKKGAETDLIKVMRAKGHERFTSAVWAEAVERKDKLATELIDRAVEMLGVGIASTCNLLDVEAVLIGGGLGVRFGQPYVERIRHAMQPHLFPGHRPPIVELVGLGDLGGALGAALLVA